MSDLKLNLASNDLVIVNGDLQLTSPGPESLAQRLSIKLRFFKGEFFLNIDFGIPYVQEIFVKPVVVSSINAIFKSQIIDTPGVEELTDYSSDYEPIRRSFSLDFSVISDEQDSVSIVVPINF